MARRRAHEAEVEEGGMSVLERLSDYSPLRLLPEETRHHVRAAQREMLLAARSFIDEMIAELEVVEERRERRATKVEVE